MSKYKKARKFDPYSDPTAFMVDSCMTGISKEEWLKQWDKYFRDMHDDLVHKMLIVQLILKEAPKMKLETVTIDGMRIILPVYDDEEKNLHGLPVSQVMDTLFGKVRNALTRHEGGEDSFPRIKEYWGDATEEVTAAKMALLKIARIEGGVSVDDSYVDAIGYLVLAYKKHLEGK